MFINDEVPSGVINGVNRVFTLLNNPTKMVSVTMDGADYKDYTVYENILTLTDAPSAALYVDYFYGVTPALTTSDVTLGDIVSKVYNLLGQKPTSTTFGREIVVGKINNLIREICKGRYTTMGGMSGGSVVQGATYRCGSLWFLQGSFPIRIQEESVLGADYSIGDSTITCDTSYLLSSGYVFIGGEIISYTSKTTTTLEGVTGATITHLEGEAIVQLYDTPIAMSKPSEVNLIFQNKYATEIPIPFDDSNKYTVSYNILRFGTKQLLRFNGIQVNRLVEVKYTKVVDNLSADADLCILPEDYGITVIAYLAAGELGMEKGMPNSQPHMAMGSSKLRTMFGDLSNTITITKQKLSPTSYSRL